MAYKEAEIKLVLAGMEKVKGDLADLIEKYEDAEESERLLNMMTEALDAMEDAADVMQEIILNEI
ncbi:MAG: hypothetical protein Q4B22_06185 [Eubacteriales bacterium]|nr:hypothetical protein [Eubacteriales bacterium]